jgi:selenocysteine lyase/cysteine desulfurase
VEVVQVPSHDGATVAPVRFADAVDEHTAFLATSHVYFTTGAIQDLRALADVAHRRGALLLVDAYQGAGQVPIDVKAANVDILVTGPLKWLMGGPGLAYLYVRRELAHLRPTIAGWFGARDPFAFAGERLELRQDARRFELGTPALPTVHAALGGQEIVDEIGVPAIRARNSALTEHLRGRLLDAGWRLREAAQPRERSAIVMVAHPDEQGCVARLAEAGIIVDSRPGHVRISPHFYNTVDELDMAVEHLGKAP